MTTSERGLQLLTEYDERLARDGGEEADAWMNDLPAIPFMELTIALYERNQAQPSNP